MSAGQWLRGQVARLKTGTERLNYGRDIVTAMGLAAIVDSERVPARVLDLGVGGGTDLINLRDAAGPERVALFGIDVDSKYLVEAAALGIAPTSVDIERERLPFDDGFFDLVVANQVIEHTKEIFWIFSEVSRVLRPGGSLVVGVPNLASLHNRVLLLCGQQPAAIDVLGPHVRGFTRRALEAFVETDDYFVVRGFRGANFYPFPPSVARPLSRWLPTLAVGLFLRCERTRKPGVFGDVLRTRRFETAYFPGPSEAPRGSTVP